MSSLYLAYEYIILSYNTYIEILTYIVLSCIILYSFDEHTENLQGKSLCIDYKTSNENLLLSNHLFTSFAFWIKKLSNGEYE